MICLISTETAASWGTLAGIFLVGIMTQFHAWKAKVTAETVRKKVVEADAKRDALLVIIHALVNGDRTNLLQKLAETSTKLAEATNDPGTQASATRAVQDYTAQVDRQKALDIALAQARDIAAQAAAVRNSIE